MTHWRTPRETSRKTLYVFEQLSGSHSRNNPPEGCHGRSVTPSLDATSPVLSGEGSFSLQFRDRVCLAWLGLLAGSVGSFLVALVIALRLA